jgi:osmotically-inducible protein OsmY
MKKIRVVVILVFCSILTGCVPLLIGGAGAVVTTVVLSDRRSMKTMMQDREIVNQAQTMISEDAALQGRSHISVVSFNHHVLLMGQVQTAELRTKVYDMMRRIPKVRKIYNQLVISGVTTDLARTDDAWITTKVKTAMLMEPGLHSLQLKVVTENGVVYLMGILTRVQADSAVDVVRRVRGVKKVVKVFEYRDKQ